MGDALILRPVAPGDAGAIAAIYAHYVRETTVSFEIEPPGAAEIAQRIAQTVPHFPYLVAEADGELLGYAYAGQFHRRAAYRWIVETTVYIRHGSARRGIGRMLYTALLDQVRAQGFCGAVGLITLPNAASVGLHEAMGFTQTGCHRKVGYKLGGWYDVGLWQIDFGERPADPADPSLPSV